MRQSGSCEESEAKTGNKNDETGEAKEGLVKDLRWL
jgi:hypothetical protein